MTLSEPPFCQEPAIYAWKDSDSSVVETNIQVPNDGKFILAAKATFIGLGWWRYEYALYNMNSDRSARAFRVPLPTDLSRADLQAAGFHDLSYHSGEAFDGTDWPATVAVGSITWTTQAYGCNVNANALRWGTLYNFRFEAKRPPNYASTVTIKLFKPTGTPASVTGVSVSPAASPVGACCTGGACSVTTQTGCGGTFKGANTDCQVCNGNDICDPPAPVGACCYEGGPPQICNHFKTQCQCELECGVYAGNGTRCSSIDCNILPQQAPSGP